jgi:glycosyltransferase involved in cell wall biosynthesis
MRILQVVSLLSPDGAFGGPARVALNQSAELIRQGHDVTLAAGTRGYPSPPVESDGVPLRLFPVRTLLPFLGFSGMTAPGLYRWVRAHLDDFDVVHIHLGRDLMVLPVAALARRHGAAYVVQTHGMVIPSRHPLAGPLDALWTRRILIDAAAVFCLNDQELHQVGDVGGPDVHAVLLPNGVPGYHLTRQRGDTPEVLFLARLHARKRPVLFVEMAHRLLAEGLRARFTLVGPDEGEGPPVMAAIGGESRIRWEGPVDPDQYPMAVLEAMSVGVPVVVAADCGLAPVIRDTRSGKVADDSVEKFAAAVRAVLHDADAYGQRASETARRNFAMDRVARRLLAVYQGAIHR